MHYCVISSNYETVYDSACRSKSIRVAAAVATLGLLSLITSVVIISSVTPHQHSASTTSETFSNQQHPAGLFCSLALTHSHIITQNYRFELKTAVQFGSWLVTNYNSGTVPTACVNMC